MSIENRENAIRVTATNLLATGLSVDDVQTLIEGILDTSSKSTNQWACRLVEESVSPIADTETAEA